MSQEHEKTSTNIQVSTDIYPVASPFEPAYQPGTLPQLSVPDLSDDAEGISAEALANIPTLTDLVDPSPDSAPVVPTVQEPAPVIERTEDIPVAQGPRHVDVVVAMPQAHPPQADTWGEQLQVRMGKLTGDIDSLNARLDRLDEQNKTKV